MGPWHLSSWHLSSLFDDPAPMRALEAFLDEVCRR